MQLALIDARQILVWCKYQFETIHYSIVSLKLQIHEKSLVFSTRSQLAAYIHTVYCLSFKNAKGNHLLVLQTIFSRNGTGNAWWLSVYFRSLKHISKPHKIVLSSVRRHDFHFFQHSHKSYIFASGRKFHIYKVGICPQCRTNRGCNEISLTCHL